jgi:hypothetical protein
VCACCRGQLAWERHHCYPIQSFVLSQRCEDSRAAPTPDNTRTQPVFPRIYAAAVATGFQNVTFPFEWVFSIKVDYG